MMVSPEKQNDVESGSLMGSGIPEDPVNAGLYVRRQNKNCLPKRPRLGLVRLRRRRGASSWLNVAERDPETAAARARNAASKGSGRSEGAILMREREREENEGR